MRSCPQVRWSVIGKVNHGNYLSHSSVVYHKDYCITGIVKLKKGVVGVRITKQLNLFYPVAEFNFPKL